MTGPAEAAASFAGWTRNYRESPGDLLNHAGPRWRTRTRTLLASSAGTSRGRGALHRAIACLLGAAEGGRGGRTWSPWPRARGSEVGGEAGTR